MKRIAMIGMPNTGKSTLFNRLTGSHAKVGNWPGLTVELLSARLPIGDQMVQLVDLPGIYDLDGYSDDERVVTRFLDEVKLDALLFVMNASQTLRQQQLLAQLLQRADTLGLPVVLAFNMLDEASALGIRIDSEAIAAGLGLPTCLLSAKYGQGTERLLPALRAALQTGAQNLTPSDPAGFDTARFERIMQSSIDVPALASHQLTERLDRVLLHPLFGLPIFFGVMFGLFQLVFTLGKPLQDALAWGFGELRSAALEPLLSTLLSTLPAALQSSLLQGFLLDGLYNGLSTVASFVPLIVLFFLFMGMVEDAGYLSRAAFLMDGLMARFGLDGRSFVMLLMGFGCNVPALMGTRVIRSRGLRLLTMMVIPFSLCSARMQVFVFFIAILFSPSSGPLVLFSLYLFGILSAVLTSLLFKRQLVNNEAFVLEMPPYRFPTLRQMLLRGWSEVGHFLKRATRFIIAGVTAVWLLTHFPADAAPGSLDTWAGQLGSLLDPLMRPLGIDPMLTIALMFGFIAKEIVIGSLAVIYNQEGSALSATIAQQIDAIQAYSFMLFTLIYTPCLSTVATLQAESKSLRFTVMAVLWPLLLAWLASFVFYQLARLLTS